MTTTIELTPRQIALCEGRDPNTVDETTATTEATTEAATTEGGTDPSKDDEQPETAEDTTDAESKGEVELGSEGSGSADEDTKEWYASDDVKALAQSYGLTDDDLREFGSVEDFNRYSRIQDRKRLAETPKELDKKPATGKPEASESQEASGSKGKDATVTDEVDEELIDPEALAKEGYDEITVRLAKTVRALQEKVKKQPDVSKQVAEAIEELKRVSDGTKDREAEAAKAQFREFDQYMDEVSEPLFGKVDAKTGALDDKAVANREKVWGAMVRLHEGDVSVAKANGREPSPPNIKLLARRAVDIVFSKEVEQQKRSQRTEQIKKQSSKRRPVGNSAAGKPRGASDEPVTAKTIAEDPDIQRYLSGLASG